MARVSPTGAEDTIDVQVARLRSTVAATQDATLVGLIEDEFVSGKLSFEDRPGGLRMMGMVCGRVDLRCRGNCGTSRTIDEVRVTKVDRLARNLLAAAEIQKFLEAHGVALNILELNVNTGTREGRLMFNLFASIAEGERESILERTMGGKYETALEGKWAGGRLPFGLALDDEGRVIATDDAVIVQAIFENVALHGATTFTEAARTGLTQRVIHRMLHNRIYTGEASITVGGKEKAAARVRAGGDASRVVGKAGSAPVLVSQALFDQAAAALTRNRKNATRNRQYDYLLSGQLTCAHCGRVYTGRWDGRHAYYYCSKRECFGRPVQGELAEAALWSLVQQAYTEPQALIAVANHAPDAADRAPAIQAELDSVVAALEVIRVKREAINESIDDRRRDKAEGMVVLTALAAQRPPLQRRQADLELELRAAQDAQAAKFRALIRPADAIEQIDLINSTNDRAAMRKIIASCVVKAEVVTHLNRKKPFLQVTLALRDALSILPLSSRRGDSYQQTLVSVTVAL
jgi:site-specific DNA recombinase